MIPPALQNPSQPANVEFPVGVAVRVTVCVPAGNPENVHVPLVVPVVTVQSMPGGLLVIVPLPLPKEATVIEAEPKVAVTFSAWLIVTVQGPVPGHVVAEPLTVQLVNTDPAWPKAVRVTD